jgi:hypothetical protein
MGCNHEMARQSVQSGLVHQQRVLQARQLFGSVLTLYKQ